MEGTAAELWAGTKARFRMGVYERGQGHGFALGEFGEDRQDFLFVEADKDGRLSASFLRLRDAKAAGAPFSALAERASKSEADASHDLLAFGCALRPPLTLGDAFALFGMGGKPCKAAAGVGRRFGEALVAAEADRTAAEMAQAPDDAARAAVLAEARPRMDAAKLAAETAVRAAEAEFAAALDAAGVGRIRRCVREDAARALRATSAFNWGDYAFYAQEGERGLRRRQAADAYPMLAVLLARRPSLRLAIDASKPLAAAIQQALGVPAPALKRLAGAEVDPQGLPPDFVLRSIADLPPDWAPKDAAGWAAFHDLSASVGFTLKDVARLDAQTLYAGCAGRWEQTLQRLVKAGGLASASRVRLVNAARDVGEMVNAFADQVVLPAAANATGEPEAYLSGAIVDEAKRGAAELLFEGRSAVAIFETSRAWQRQRVAVATAAASRHPEDGWPALTAEAQAPNGLWIVPLVSPQALTDEGAAGLNDPGPDSNGVMGLGHCVGGYAENCRRHGRHILSIRRVSEDRRSFTRLSTAEVGSLSGSGPQRLKVHQHRGEKNGEVPLAALEAWDWYAAEVAEGRIKIDWEAIKAFSSTVAVEGDALSRTCGYAWNEPDKVLKAFEAWTLHLPKRWRGAGLDALLGSEAVARVAAEMSPAYARRRSG